MAEKNYVKKCFVIAPIGAEGSETRQRSDQILKHLITPATKECGYQAIRADKISEPGIITSQVIQHLIDDDLVIADLTEKNPNVFYELAIRHAIKKPVVQIIQVGESIPFDVSMTRTIPVNYRDLDSVDNCRDELIKQIRTVEKDPSKVDSPVSVAIDLQSLYQSKNPLEKSTTKIISMLQELKSYLSYESRGPRFNPAFSKEFLIAFGQLFHLIELSEGQKLTREKVEEIRHHFHQLEQMFFMAMEDSRLSRYTIEDLMRPSEVHRSRVIKLK
jgi:hypothetical protein